MTMINRAVSPLGKALFLLVLLVFLLACLPGPALAQKDDTSNGSNNQIQPRDFIASLEKTLNEEKNNRALLEERLKDLQQTTSALDNELNMFSIQVSTYNNLLLLTTVPVDDLERIQLELKSAVGELKKRLDVVGEKQQEIDRLRIKTEEQNALNERQLSEIKKKATKDAEVNDLRGRFKELADVLVKKQQVLENLYQGYSYQLVKLGEMQREYSALSDKFSQRIVERKQQAIFEKHSGLAGQVSPAKIREEAKLIFRTVVVPLSRHFWTEQVFPELKTRFSLLVAVVLTFGIFFMLILRLHVYLKGLDEKQYFPEGSWRRLGVRVFQNTLPLLGITLLVYAYTRSDFAYSSAPLIRAVVNVLILWLFSQWVRDALVFSEEDGLLRIPPPLFPYLNGLIIMIRIFGIPYVALAWLLGSQGGLLILWRLIFEVIFILWSILFCRVLHFLFSAGLEDDETPRPAVAFLVMGASYALPGIGFLLELFGYGQFALYWYVSWARTATVLLWSMLAYRFLREWKEKLAAAVAGEKHDHHNIDYSARWFLIQIFWIVLIVAFFVSLLLAWGLKQTVIIGIFSVLSRPLTVGGMSISLPGILFAVLILLFTHGATRVWRYLLLNRLLVGSGLQRGVQESVASISVYLFWFFGIILSLHILGVKTTSIAIAFGALGIGLGFGLQTIFNNFISGIILLFERPIQVGDVIELDGTWGTITKINVRSTVVQTFDNASLIIPNAEFISNKLTNWSFKDLRVRRTVTVGVAYGSDVKLVQQALSEAAENNTRVYKRPKHDVLFTDFGDSALIFKLRIWTHVDTCLTAETELRYEIDRLFRERNIEIAFPQLDVHVRSIAGQNHPDASTS